MPESKFNRNFPIWPGITAVPKLKEKHAEQPHYKFNKPPALEVVRANGLPGRLPRGNIKDWMLHPSTMQSFQILPPRLLPELQRKPRRGDRTKNVFPFLLGKVINYFGQPIK